MSCQSRTLDFFTVQRWPTITIVLSMSTSKLTTGSIAIHKWLDRPHSKIMLDRPR